MSTMIDLKSLEITKDGVNLGHVCDAILNDPTIAAEAKAALDLAWIAKGEQINAKAHEVAALKSKLDEGLA